MTSSRSRRKQRQRQRQRQQRRPFNGSPDDHAPTEQWLTRLRTGPGDGTTAVFTGASIIGVPDDVTVITVQPGPGPRPSLPRYRPAAASFPALPPPGPDPAWSHVTQILAPVDPLTETAVIGNSIRLPHVWCGSAACIAWHQDPDALGEADARQRAIADGWRHDAFGRLTCPACQQRDPAFRTTQPAAWGHPEVARRWWGQCSPRQCFCGPGGHVGELLSEDDRDRLAVMAEHGRRVSRRDPALARDITDATARHRAGT
jgi:hypothetical protein